MPIYKKKKKDSIKNLSESRLAAKKNLLKAVNPILKKYMEDNKIRMIIDKQRVVMGDKDLEITDKIITILDKELPSIKLN